jgi:hypothetical protein
MYEAFFFYILEILDVTAVLYFEVCGKYQEDGIDTRGVYG